jgi:hypothetical protein
MPENMNLAVLLDRIDDLPDEFTIYVANTGELSPATPAVARSEPADGLAPSDMRYLLEVPLAREAIKVWSDWRHGRSPSSDDKANAVIYYGENDAYMPLE